MTGNKESMYVESVAKMFENISYNSDHETVSLKWDKPSVYYHYSWLESEIINNINFPLNTVLDVGPGYGHWMAFYKKVYNANVSGLEISRPMKTKLNCFYGDIVSWKNGRYDIVNAIGVLHHIKKDKDLINAINNIKEMAKKMIIIGTRFDYATKEKTRWYRPLDFWKEHLPGCRVVRSNPDSHLKKHLDLIICSS